MPFPLTDAQLNALLDEIPALAGRPRQLQDLSGGLTNRNVKVTTPDGVYVARCTDTSTNFLGIDRDAGVLQPRAAEQARRRRAGDRLPARSRHPAAGLPQRKDAVQRRLPAAGGDGQGGRGMPGTALRARGSAAASTCSNASRSYLKTVRDNGFQIPHDYLDYADTFDRIREALTGHRPDHRPVQQRPAGGQLHRRRRPGLAHRLRVLRQQRPVLRTRQHLERVRPVHRSARRTRHRVLRPPAAAQDRPRPPAGHRRQVRLDAVGLHPKRLQRNGFRLLGLGHGALRSRRRRVQGSPLRPAARRRARHRLDSREP